MNPPSECRPLRIALAGAGAIGSFMLSDSAASPRSCGQTSRENKQYASYDDEDCYVIAGTRGSLSIPTMRLRTCGPGTAPSWFAPFDTQVVDLRVVEAIAEAARSGKRIDLRAPGTM
jgi:hypothetical protein